MAQLPVTKGSWVSLTQSPPQAQPSGLTTFPSCCGDPTSSIVMVPQGQCHISPPDHLPKAPGFSLMGVQEVCALPLPLGGLEP